MPRPSVFTVAVKIKVIAAKCLQTTAQTPKGSINIRRTENTASGVSKTPQQIVAATLLPENISDSCKGLHPVETRLDVLKRPVFGLASLLFFCPCTVWLIRVIKSKAAGMR